MIPMIKCVKHGLCRADVVHICRACKTEKKNQSNDQTLNEFKVETALEMFNEWWCGYRGTSHDVADYEDWLKKRQGEKPQPPSPPPGPPIRLIKETDVKNFNLRRS